MLSSQSCFCAFCWSAIPTSCYIFNVFYSCILRVPTALLTSAQTCIFHVERYVGWGCILNCFMLSSLPCFCAFCWSAIPIHLVTFLMFFILVINVLYCHCMWKKTVRVNIDDLTACKKMWVVLTYLVAWISLQVHDQSILPYTNALENVITAGTSISWQFHQQSILPWNLLENLITTAM